MPEPTYPSPEINPRQVAAGLGRAIERLDAAAGELRNGARDAGNKGDPIRMNHWRSKAEGIQYAANYLRYFATDQPTGASDE